MSQVELGGGRYSGSYISHLESGRRTPTPDVIDFLARQLGVSPLEWGVRTHFDKEATLRAEASNDPAVIEELLVAERAWYDRDWTAAEAHAERAAASAQVAGDGVRHWEALYVVAQARFANADFASAARIAQEISEHQAARRHAVARAQSLSLASIANRAGSRLGWAIAYGARAVETAAELPPIIRAEAVMALVSALSEAGHGRDEIDVYVQQLDEMIPLLTASHARGMVAWTIGTAAYSAGDVSEGEERYRQAGEWLVPQRDLRLWLRFHRSLANCRLDTGQTDGVGELLRISSTGLEIIGNAFDVVDLRQAQARLALATGDPARTLEIVDGLLNDPVLGNPEYNRGMSEWIRGEALCALGRQPEARVQYAVAAHLFEEDGRLKQALEAYHRLSESCGRNLTSGVDTDGQVMM